MQQRKAEECESVRSISIRKSVLERGAWILGEATKNKTSRNKHEKAWATRLRLGVKGEKLFSVCSTVADKSILYGYQSLEILHDKTVWYRQYGKQETHKTIGFTTENRIICVNSVALILDASNITF